MREIKFRAFDKINKKMYQVTWLALPSPSKNGYIFGQFRAGGEIIEKECLVKDLELMQFTGLTDKNGKEIYEGDIVKNEYYRGHNLVEWREKEARFLISGYGKWEVIGNIYENKELINADSKAG